MHPQLPLAIAEVTLDFSGRPVTGAELAALVEQIIEPSKEFVAIPGYHDGDTIGFGQSSRNSLPDHLLVIPSHDTPFFKRDGETYASAIVRNHFWVGSSAVKGDARAIIEAVRKFAASLRVAYLDACTSSTFPTYREPRVTRSSF